MAHYNRESQVRITLMCNLKLQILFSNLLRGFQLSHKVFIGCYALRPVAKLKCSWGTRWLSVTTDAVIIKCCIFLDGDYASPLSSYSFIVISQFYRLYLLSDVSFLYLQVPSFTYKPTQRCPSGLIWFLSFLCRGRSGCLDFFSCGRSQLAIDGSPLVGWVLVCDGSGGCCAVAHACQPVTLSPPWVLSVPHGEDGLRHCGTERHAAPSLAVTSAGLRCHGLSLTYVKPSFSQLSPTICQVRLGAHSVRFAMQARWQLENRAVLPA